MTFTVVPPQTDPRPLLTNSKGLFSFPFISILIILCSSWKQELTKEKPNFRRALVKTFWVDMIPIVLLSLLIEVFISNAIPVLLAYVIDFFVEKNPLSFEFTCWCGAGIIVLNFSYGILHHLSFYASTRLGIKVRVAWVTLLYRKVSDKHKLSFVFTVNILGSTNEVHFNGEYLCGTSAQLDFQRRHPYR